MTIDIETRVRDLIVSVVGETEAANIDLSRVTRHHYERALTVGDSHYDGCLTVGPSDYVDVWAQGDPVTTEDLPAHVPGSFEHFKDVYDTSREGGLVAWATTRRSMHDADPGIAVTRRDGGTWLAFSDSSALPDTWGDPDPGSDYVELDTEAADAELERLGYRRTGSQWISSGGQWATDVEKAPADASPVVSLPDDLTGAALHHRDDNGDLILIGWKGESPATDEIAVNSEREAWNMLDDAGYLTHSGGPFGEWGFSWDVDGSAWAPLERKEDSPVRLTEGR